MSDLADNILKDKIEDLRKHIEQHYSGAFQVGKALSSLHDVEIRLTRPPKKAELRVLENDG